jgi:hypothetical protein
MTVVPFMRDVVEDMYGGITTLKERCACVSSPSVANFLRISSLWVAISGYFRSWIAYVLA